MRNEKVADDAQHQEDFVGLAGGVDACEPPRDREAVHLVERAPVLAVRREPSRRELDEAHKGVDVRELLPPAPLVEPLGFVEVVEGDHRLDAGVAQHVAPARVPLDRLLVELTLGRLDARPVDREAVHEGEHVGHDADGLEIPGEHPCRHTTNPHHP